LLRQYDEGFGRFVPEDFVISGVRLRDYVLVSV
jgi:hypothetical protein